MENVYRRPHFITLDGKHDTSVLETSQNLIILVLVTFKCVIWHHLLKTAYIYIYIFGKGVRRWPRARLWQGIIIGWVKFD